MTDRELLELAALAAGLRVVRWDDAGQAFRVLDDSEHRFAFWNPLTDDGDALRLLVDIHARAQALPVGFGFARVEIFLGGWQDFNESEDGDQYGAMRRAIVRAAAEIGRTMKEAGK